MKKEYTGCIKQRSEYFMKTFYKIKLSEFSMEKIFKLCLKHATRYLFAVTFIILSKFNFNKRKLHIIVL